MQRASFLATFVAATMPQSRDATVWHVAIFSFPPEHLARAIDGFRTMRRASRRHAGNLAYDVFRSTEDAGTFFILEHWATAAALSAHERTPVFSAVGRDVLVRYATLHDTVTGIPLA